MTDNSINLSPVGQAEVAVEAAAKAEQAQAEAAVAHAESEGLAVVASEKSKVLDAIAGLEQHIRTIEAEFEAFTTHERSAVEQYLLALKTRVHSLLLRL